MGGSVLESGLYKHRPQTQLLGVSCPDLDGHGHTDQCEPRWSSWRLYNIPVL